MAPDLSGLQMKTDIPHPHRRGHKAVLTILLLCLPPLGFIGYKFRHSFVPVPTVMVRPVVIIESTSAEKVTAPDELLFQAAGWIEPEPKAVKVPVFTKGFVKE